MRSPAAVASAFYPDSGHSASNASFEAARPFVQAASSRRDGVADERTAKDTAVVQGAAR